MKNSGHKFFKLFFKLFFFLHTSSVFSTVHNLQDQVGRDYQDRIDPNVDYERFSGRVSDKDETSRTFKIKVENNNTKFFRAGDLVLFKVNLDEKKDYCKGFVRSVEDFYFTLYVDGLSPCYSEEKYFRRGTVLNFYSKALAIRVFEASQYRDQLILKKENFLNQLNSINHFIWSFDQEKVKVAVKFDQEIAKIERQKQLALDDLLAKRHEKLVLQLELKKSLNQLDESLKFYRIERQEYLTDRWNSDHDLGIPFGQRPQEMRKP